MAETQAVPLSRRLLAELLGSLLLAAAVVGSGVPAVAGHRLTLSWIQIAALALNLG